METMVVDQIGYQAVLATLLDLNRVKKRLITNLTVNVNITHQRPSDLEVYLVGPDGGPPVQLFNFSGDNAVADFNGESSLGLWTLEVYDTRKKRTGTLSSFADIDFVHQQFQHASLFLGVQQFPDRIQPLQRRGNRFEVGFGRRPRLDLPD